MLSRDELFLALTRPTLKWGVPLEALLVNLTFWFMAGIELQAPTWWRQPMWFWLMGIPVHFVLRWKTGQDYHWVRTIKLEILTMMYTELTNLPEGPPRNSAEIPSGV